MSTVKKYDEEYKKEAVKLAEKVGNKAAAEQLGIPTGTVGTWVRSSRMAAAAETSKEESEEHGVVYELRRQLKEKEKEIKRLKEENEIEELFYSRNRKSTDYTIDELKTMIWILHELLEQQADMLCKRWSASG